MPFGMLSQVFFNEKDSFQRLSILIEIYKKVGTENKRSRDREGRQ